MIWIRSRRHRIRRANCNGLMHMRERREILRELLFGCERYPQAELDLGIKFIQDLLIRHPGCGIMARSLLWRHGIAAFDLPLMPFTLEFRSTPLAGPFHFAPNGSYGASPQAWQAPLTRCISCRTKA